MLPACAALLSWLVLFEMDICIAGGLVRKPLAASFKGSLDRLPLKEVCSLLVVDWVTPLEHHRRTTHTHALQLTLDCCVITCFSSCACWLWVILDWYGVGYL